MPNSTDLETLGEVVERICKEEQAQKYEAFLTKKSRCSISKSHRSQQTTIQSEAESTIGLAVRLSATENTLGFAYSSDIDEESIREIITGAKKNVLPARGFSDFTEPAPPTKVDRLFDERIDEFLTDPMILEEHFERVQQKIASYPNVVLQGVDFTPVKIETFILNSNNLKVSSIGSYFSFEILAAIKDQIEKTSCYRHKTSRIIADIPFESMIEDLNFEMNCLTKTTNLTTQDVPAIITANAASDLYGYQFEPMICLSGAAAGVSKFGDKIGAQVASERLTLYDSAIIPGGQYSSIFDDEGVPTQHTIIIEKGILKGFLSDTIQAYLNKSKSTGNCARMAIRHINNYNTREYSNRPIISPSNLCVEPGDATDEELIREMKEGYVINILSGGITITDPSGDFNILGTHLFKVENGEIIGCVERASVAGNWYTIFKDVELVSKNQEQSMSSLGASCYMWPKLLIRSLKFKPL